MGVALRILRASFVVLLLSITPTLALDFGKGPLPIAFEPDRAVALPADGRIVIEGTVEGTAPVTIVLRIDDAQSIDYASRFNDERTLPPGPFALAFEVASLRATGGRVLDASHIKRAIVFIVGDGRAQVTKFQTLDAGARPPTPVAAPQTAAAQTPVGFSFGTGNLPIAFEPAQPITLDAAGHIDIAGTVDGAAPVTVVLRVDDGRSTNYASRMNEERVLAPGPFALRFEVANLRAGDGRSLDATDIRRVILFTVGPGTARVSHFVLALPQGLGVASAPLSPTTTTVAPTAPAELSRLAFGSGALPIAFEPDAPVALPAGVLEIAGTITSAAPVTLVFRIDDTAAPDYNSRMNEERTLPPGPFELSLDTRTLKTSGGRPLNPALIRRMILFVAGVGSGTVSRFEISNGAAVDVSPAPAQHPAPPNSAVATGRLLGSGNLPLRFEPASPAAFSGSDEIRVEGVVTGLAPAALAVRVDDAASSNYPTRYNDERMIPPGPFSFSIGLKGLKTPSGRVLDPAKISRIILFAWQGRPQVTITRFETARSASLPDGAKGYSFGAVDAAVLAGFERIGPTDPRITGRGPVVAVRRPAPDPLVANGVRGVRRVVLSSPPGRVRVTVWTEDPGEWDLLPHPLARRIQVNGRDLLVEASGAEAWIAQRYLRGAKSEHTAADDAWTAYGSKRGDPRVIDVDVARDGITIEISGNDNAAYYLAAVLVEPVSQTATAGEATVGQQFVNAQRAAWYRSTVPVAPPLADDHDGTIQLSLDWSQVTATKSETAKIEPLRQRAAPGTAASFKFAITSQQGLARPRVTIDAPRRNGVKLPTRLWAAQARLERDDTVLRLKAVRLLADVASLPLKAGEARGYELWVDVPDGTPPGTYTGALVMADTNSSRARSYQIEISVLAVTLPPVAKPAGFYLARAAHLAYFPGLTIERERQAQCDLDTLRGFGLTNTAPPIGGLDRTDLGVFANDMRRAGASGIAPGWLIYNPLHDLLAAQGPARTSDVVARLDEMIRAQGMPQPLWSVADEPSNADQSNAALPDFVKLLRTKARTARLAGHLNAPGDEKFAKLFDTILLNQGFGIDAPVLDRLRKSGKGVWLYNTFAPRQTAGLWLWRTAAERYVQWHARLPTGDPFDPIDGREADFQMLYPTAEICPKQPDIHRDLLRMAEGVIDQRWLLWLDANPTPAAKALAVETRARLPGPFADARDRPRSELEALRNRIMDLVSR